MTEINKIESVLIVFVCGITSLTVCAVSRVDPNVMYGIGAFAVIMAIFLVS